jgi:WD40 repeat protein
MPLLLCPLWLASWRRAAPAGLALVLFLLPAGLVLSSSTRGSLVGVTLRVLLVFQVSSDSRYLAAGGHDRSIHVWDVRSRQYVKAFSGHRGAVSVRPLLPAQPGL